MKISDWACFFYFSLKLLSYEMFNTGEGGWGVVKVMIRDVLHDLASVPMFALWRISSEENRKICIQGFVIGTVFPDYVRVIIESYGRLRDDLPPEMMSSEQLVWLYVITLALIGVKLVLRKYCSRSRSSTVRVFAKEHSGWIDVASLFSVILSNNFYWQIDPIVAMLIIPCMMMKWHRRLFARDIYHHRAYGAVPPGFIQRLNQLASNHHRLILRVNYVSASFIRDNYHVRMLFELPEEISIECAYRIEETLRRKIEELPEVGRATVYSPQGRLRLMF